MRNAWRRKRKTSKNDHKSKCEELKMGITERQNEILRIIGESTYVSVNELSRLTFTSPSSVRRDLTYLEHLGLVNLFQRFRLVYGEECAFDIRQSAMGGACVEIRTPKTESVPHLLSK